MKVSRKIVSGLHAAVDELAASNPEALEALQTVLSSLMATDTAVSVSAKGRKSKIVKNEDLEDDEEEVAPKRGRSKKVEEDDTLDDGDDDDDNGDDDNGEGDDEDEDGETVDLDDLDASTITEAFEGLGDVGEHDRVNGKAGIRELTASVEEFGFDAAMVLKKAKAKTPAEKKEALADWLNRIHAVIDGIIAFELDAVVDAIEEITGEAFKPKGRSADAKELSAASELFRAAMAAE